jgi:hypothetical protein
MFPAGATRVNRNTAASVNNRIRQQTEGCIAHFEKHPEDIPRHLEELDQEWDIERIFEVSSSTLSLTGLGLGLGVNRKWLILPIAVQSFFLYHALQGWCPPLPLFRRMGFRTQREIEAERHALMKILNTHRQNSVVAAQLQPT